MLGRRAREGWGTPAEGILTRTQADLLAVEIPRAGFPFLDPGSERPLTDAEFRYLTLPGLLPLAVYLAVSGQANLLVYLDPTLALRTEGAKPGDREAQRDLVATYHRAICLLRHDALRAIHPEPLEISFLYLTREDPQDAEFGSIQIAPRDIQTVFLAAHRMEVAQPRLGLVVPPEASKDTRAGDPTNPYMTIESLAFTTHLPFVDVLFTGVLSQKVFTAAEIVDHAQKHHSSTAHGA